MCVARALRCPLEKNLADDARLPSLVNNDNSTYRRSRVDRLWRSFDSCDPTKEIQVAWAVKERLRLLLNNENRPRSDGGWPISTRPRSTRTFPRRQDCRNLVAILIALTHDVSNARTAGFNRIIKQTKRVGCGFRSQVNYQRRILSHIAVTRPQRSAA